MKIKLSVAVSLAMVFALSGFAYAAGFSDTFSRSDGALAGSATETGGYTWSAVNRDKPENAAAAVQEGAMVCSLPAYAGVQYSWPEGFQAADFELTFDVNISGLAPDASWGGVQYRATTPGIWPTDGGYLLMFRGYPADSHGDMWLFGGPEAQVGSSDGWHSVRVLVVGARHQVWWDGEQKIDYSDGGVLAAGNIQFMLCNSSSTNTILFDNIDCTAVPEPSSMLALLVSGLGVAVTGLRRRRI